MKNDKDQKRRSPTEQVLYCLRHAGDEKRLVGGTKEATQHIEEAYNLCERYGALIDKPFPRLVAYRRALLRLRKEGLCPEDLEDIDSDLRKATGLDEESPGPWPYLYRLAVLSRLAGHNEDRKTLLKQISLCHQRALAVVRSALKREQEEDEKGAVGGCRDLIQSHLFNAFELATFFLKLSYEGLEGLGTLANEFVDQANKLGLEDAGQHWIILSSMEDMADYAFGRVVARKWFNEQKKKLREAGLAALCLEWDNDSSLFSLRDLNGSEVGSAEQVELIYHLLRKPGISRDDLVDTLDVSSKQLRQRLFALRNTLRSVFKKEMLHGESNLRITPDTPIIAVLDRSHPPRK